MLAIELNHFSPFIYGYWTPNGMRVQTNEKESAVEKATFRSDVGVPSNTAIVGGLFCILLRIVIPFAFACTKASSLSRRKGGGGGGGNGLVAVAVDKDNKGSRYALKWAADTLEARPYYATSTPHLNLHLHLHLHHHTETDLSILQRICSVPSIVIVHAKMYVLCSISLNWIMEKHKLTYSFKFHQIQCLDVLLEDTDVVKGITEYLAYAAIENLVLGAASRHGFIRFKSSTPSTILKGAPDFCNVYVISKGKISSVRTASRPAPHASPLLNHIHSKPNESDVSSRLASFRGFTGSQFEFGRRISLSGRSCMDLAEPDTDISFISSGRASTASAHSASVFYDYIDLTRNSRTSTSSDRSFGSTRMGLKFPDTASPDYSFSQDSSLSSLSCSLHSMDEVETDMRRLKLELKQTMEMYSAACREALTAQHKLVELDHLRIEEEKKLDEAQLAQEAALAIAEKEKARSKAAEETAEAAKKIAGVESNRRASVELKALKEAKEMRKLLDNLTQTDTRYRRYTLEEIEIATDSFSESRKIGEGGYGPVYKCYLDHTPVAVKVLRADSAQGKSQFQQEVTNQWK
ncbi:hypothetical protein VNO77_06115 [Canavalia gladiata]|uniref:RING-type E3 ubiquitin transferase n=1 Tax=Canavalia gladiata TaxID=3824 RepID=A0AAN9MBZ4_CANGL